MENKSRKELLPLKGYAFIATCALCLLTMIVWLVQFKFMPAILFGLLAVLSYYKATNGYFVKK